MTGRLKCQEGPDRHAAGSNLPPGRRSECSLSACCTRVTRVLANQNGAKGAVAEVIDPATGQKKAYLQVIAPLLVWAAGPIQRSLCDHAGRGMSQMGRPLPSNGCGQNGCLATAFIGKAAFCSALSKGCFRPQGRILLYGSRWRKAARKAPALQSLRQAEALAAAEVKAVKAAALCTPRSGGSEGGAYAPFPR